MVYYNQAHSYLLNGHLLTVKFDMGYAKNMRFCSTRNLETKKEKKIGEMIVKNENNWKQRNLLKCKPYVLHFFQLFSCKNDLTEICIFRR